MTRRTFATMWLAPILGIACSSGSSGNGQVPATTFGSSRTTATFSSPAAPRPVSATNGERYARRFLQALNSDCGARTATTSASWPGRYASRECRSSRSAERNVLHHDGQRCAGLQRRVGSRGGGDHPGRAAVHAGQRLRPGSGRRRDVLRPVQLHVDGGSAQTQTCIQVQTLPGKAGDGPCVGSVLANGTTYSWSGPAALPAQGYLCAVADGITCGRQDHAPGSASLSQASRGALHLGR